MAWIPMYLLEKDLEYLNDWLNQEEEIAFLVSNGYKKWIAQQEHLIQSDIGKQLSETGTGMTIPYFAEYHLWHVPSGPLPLFDPNRLKGPTRHQQEDGMDDSNIPDPWSGWTEISAGNNSRKPYFGAGHPGVIDLQIKLPIDQEIRMSSFGWIGNHYKIIGNGATEETEKFWNKLRRMIKKVSTQPPRCNDSMGKKEVFAFPTAYDEIKNGRPCALNS